MVSTKVAGWLLLLLGLAIILYSLYSSWQIFTAKVPAPEVFELSSVKGSGAAGDLNLEILGLDIQLKKVLDSQIQQMLPSDTVPKFLNLFSWSILAGILVFGGAQVSSLGIKLLK